MWPLAQPTAAILGFLDGTDDEVGARTAKGGQAVCDPWLSFAGTETHFQRKARNAACQWLFV